MNIPNEMEWKEYELFDLSEHKCVIYILYDSEYKIIYIGQTLDFINRIGAHLREKKDVKKIKYFHVDSKSVDMIENDLIMFHRPKYNKIREKKVKCCIEKKNNDKGISLKDYFINNNININDFSL